MRALIESGIGDTLLSSLLALNCDKRQIISVWVLYFVGIGFILRVRALFLVTLSWVFMLVVFTEYRHLIPISRVLGILCRSIRVIADNGICDAVPSWRFAPCHYLRSICADSLCGTLSFEPNINAFEDQEAYKSILMCLYRRQ